jgi:hypothetical protein
MKRRRKQIGVLEGPNGDLHDTTGIIKACFTVPFTTLKNREV